MNHRLWASALVGLGGLVGSCQAAEKWIGPANVVTAYPHEGGLIFFLDGPAVPFSTCGSNRFQVPLSNANYKVDAAGIYLAFAAQKKVTIHVPSDAPTCDPVVDRLMIHSQ